MSLSPYICISTHTPFIKYKICENMEQNFGEKTFKGWLVLGKAIKQ